MYLGRYEVRLVAERVGFPGGIIYRISNVARSVCHGRYHNTEILGFFFGVPLTRDLLCRSTPTTKSQFVPISSIPICTCSGARLRRARMVIRWAAVVLYPVVWGILEMLKCRILPICFFLALDFPPGETFRIVNDWVQWRYYSIFAYIPGIMARSCRYLFFYRGYAWPINPFGRQ